MIPNFANCKKVATICLVVFLTKPYKTFCQNKCEDLKNGTFYSYTREGIEKPYTKKVQINYVQGQKEPVSVEWTQNSDFQTGNYKIEIYNNGFKIGEGTRSLKKGGLFG